MPLDIYTPVQSQKAVSAYFTSEQILQFGFAEQYMNIQHYPVPRKAMKSQ